MAKDEEEVVENNEPEEVTGESVGGESAATDSEEAMAEAMARTMDEAPQEASADEELDWGAAADMGQGDIDALFDAGPNEEGPSYKSVIDRIITESMANYDRLPMLDIVFERLVMMLTNSLKRLTTANSEINISSINSMRFSEAMGSIPLPGLLAVVDAKPWNGQLVVALDAPMLYSSLEMMLGGRKSTPAKAEGRSFTSIERRLGEKLTHTVLEGLEEAFAPLCQVEFSIDRMEANPQFATVAQANSPAVHAVLDVTLDDRRGRVEFVLPYGTLDSIRGLLQKVFLGERLGGDPAWEQHLREEVKASHVRLRTVLHEFEEDLGEVLAWQPGDVLELHVPADQKATISCGKIPMFAARLGQMNGSVAMRVEADLGGKEDMIDALVRR